MFVQTSHVEVTLETLTVDRKFLISASSDKQNQIVPSPNDNCPTGIAALALSFFGVHLEAEGLALPLRPVPEAPAVKREAEEDWG